MALWIAQKVVSVENLPKIPKDLILRINARKKDDFEDFSTIERRTIKVCLNGGVPVHFLDSGLNLQYESEKLKSSDFEQVELHIGNFKNVSKDILVKIHRDIENLGDHLYKKSSEAAMRYLFWDPVMNCMFQHGLEGIVKNYRIEPEWCTNVLFSEHETQWVDYTALIDLDEKQTFPILLVEIGKDPFDLDHPHKDQSKLLAIMSQTCIKLAQAMIAKKKRPEVVRIGGICIGGTTFQFIVAHPVVTTLPSGLFEIHVNCSINPHWYYDLSALSRPNNCKSICCLPSNVDSNVFERVKHGKLNLSSYKSVSISGQNVSEATLVESAPPVTKGESSSIAKAKDEKLALVNLNALEAMNYFIQYIKAQMAVMLNEYADIKVSDERKFEESKFTGLLGPSRKSSNVDTPKKSKISTEYRLSTQVIKKDITSSTKDSLNELQILLKLSSASDLFPIVYDFEIVCASPEEEIVRFEVETMKPLYDPYNERLSPKVRYNHPVDTFYGSLLLSIQTLCSLNRLHESFGIVHSDISVNNIMYSTLSGTWKLIDFGQSLEIEESLKQPRKAGTEGYVAPEVLETGIFTKESDVFALGKVLVALLYFLILGEVCISEDEELVSKDAASFGRKFCSIINAMIHPDPKKRPSTYESIEKLHDILEHFDVFKEDPIYRHVHLLLRQKQEVDKIQMQLESVHIESPQVVELREEPRAEWPSTEVGSKRSRTTAPIEERDIRQLLLTPTTEANIS